MKNQGICWTTAAESSRPRSADSLEMHAYVHATNAGTVLHGTHHMKRARKSSFDRRRPSLFWKKIRPETSDGFETWQEDFWNIREG